MKHNFRKGRTFAGMILVAGLAAVLAGCISPGDNSAPMRSGATASAFPRVEGINLQGQKIDVPNQLRGNPTLVIVAYEREQQSVIDGWLPALEELEKRRSGFRFYELPVIYETNIVNRFWITNGMRSGIENTTARYRTITLYTDREQFNEMVGISNMSTIHLLVLNANKEIVWRTSGGYSADKFIALQGVIAGM
ncbi:MAG: hypothetical protein ACQKBV_01190 [Puniceicoccales bacterium]